MLSENSIRIIGNICRALEIEVEIVPIKTTLQLGFKHQFNITVYSRIFLMDLLDDDFLWLDADLVLMPGWESIFEVMGDRDADDTIIYGVLDAKSSRGKLRVEKNRAFLASEGRYVNSGVIKVRVAEWKKLDPEIPWMEIATNISKHGLRLPDQDIINYLCAGKISLLSGAYNYIIGDFKESHRNVFIKHFAGYPKPWILDKLGKEFLMAVQGLNYFNSKHSITESRDAFIDYPAYWNLEIEILNFIREIDPILFDEIESIRASRLRSLDLPSQIKLVFLKFFAKKLR